MFRFQYWLYIFLIITLLFWLIAELDGLIWAGASVGISNLLEDIAEVLLLVSSSLTVVYLYFSRKQDKIQMQKLQKYLHKTQQHLDKVNLRLKQTGLAYHEAIQAQLLAWKLTKSEQEVALLLLKGLSFKEIAAVRQTQEKTVRQQATSIYGKANLKGRHEFSAYFFEDFLGAPQS